MYKDLSTISLETVLFSTLQNYSLFFLFSVTWITQLNYFLTAKTRTTEACYYSFSD